MDKFFGGAAAVVGGIAALICLVVILSLWQAWAATILWAWFAVPVFGLPVVSYWQMTGIMLTISAMKPRTSGQTLDNNKALGGILIGPPVMVGFGWLIKTLAGI